MKDHQLGYLPAEDDRLLGNVNAECIDDFGVGIPTRVLDEWQRRHDEKMTAERTRRAALSERKILVKQMTDGDFAGLRRRGIVIGNRIEDYAERERKLRQAFFGPDKVPEPAPKYEIRGQGKVLAQHEALRWDYTGNVQLQRDREAQAQQNQAVDAQNAYTDSLVERPSMQLGQWRPR